MSNSVGLDLQLSQRTKQLLKSYPSRSCLLLVSRSLPAYAQIEAATDLGGSCMEVLELPLYCSFLPECFPLISIHSSSPWVQPLPLQPYMIASSYFLSLFISSWELNSRKTLVEHSDYQIGFPYFKKYVSSRFCPKTHLAVLQSFRQLNFLKNILSRDKIILIWRFRNLFKFRNQMS